ncbi:hypothetical protein L484_001488 [Morus notabilis]|uniref:Uncharacterized protein n=1 Tax=Morus notabilis TaxID=981085 RepID=W9R6A5_9ROSA|nr:hypothetical protein L484_001488 [Morus notabilis]
MDMLGAVVRKQGRGRFSSLIFKTRVLVALVSRLKRKPQKVKQVGGQRGHLNEKQLTEQQLQNTSRIWLG